MESDKKEKRPIALPWSAESADMKEMNRRGGTIATLFYAIVTGIVLALSAYIYDKWMENWELTFLNFLWVALLFLVVSIIGAAVVCKVHATAFALAAYFFGALALTWLVAPVLTHVLMIFVSYTMVSSIVVPVIAVLFVAAAGVEVLRNLWALFAIGVIGQLVGYWVSYWEANGNLDGFDWGKFASGEYTFQNWLFVGIMTVWMLFVLNRFSTMPKSGTNATVASSMHVLIVGVLILVGLKKLKPFMWRITPKGVQRRIRRLKEWRAKRRTELATTGDHDNLPEVSTP